LSLPIVALGGLVRKEIVLNICKYGRVDAIFITAMFHYKFTKDNIANHTEATEGNLILLKVAM
jgi:imidazole glycerol phosphate synthase subunit HisF